MAKTERKADHGDEALYALRHSTAHVMAGAVLELTKNRGVDVVLDMVGGSYFARNIAVLAPEGRLVIIATQDGAKGEADLRTVMAKRLVITGSMLRPRDVEFKRRVRNELLVKVWPLIANERLKPVVDRVFPMSEAAAAHAYFESGVHIGKIVLDFTS